MQKFVIVKVLILISLRLYGQYEGLGVFGGTIWANQTWKSTAAQVQLENNKKFRIGANFGFFYRIQQSASISFKFNFGFCQRGFSEEFVFIDVNYLEVEKNISPAINYLYCDSHLQWFPATERKFWFLGSGLRMATKLSYSDEKIGDYYPYADFFEKFAFVDVGIVLSGGVQFAKRIIVEFDYFFPVTKALKYNNITVKNKSFSLSLNFIVFDFNTEKKKKGKKKTRRK